MVITFTLGKGGGGTNGEESGWVWIHDQGRFYAISVVKCRENDEKGYLKVKINIFLRQVNEFNCGCALHFIRKQS